MMYGCLVNVVYVIISHPWPRKARAVRVLRVVRVVRLIRLARFVKTLQKAGESPECSWIRD